MNNFSINSYASLMDTSGKWWIPGDASMYELMNLIVNIFMTLNQWLYRVVDLGLEALLENNVFENTIGSVFSVAVSLYNSLFSALGVTLFIVAIGIIYAVFAFKSPQDATRQLAALFLVIGINTAIYSNGDGYLKDVNTIFDEVESTMVSSISLPMFSQDGTETQLNAGSSDSVTSIREMYHSITIKQSFAMVNFGVSVYEDRFDDFLYTVEQENDDDAKDDLVELVNEESKSNRYMTPDGVVDKIFISVYSCVNNLFVGLPLLAIAILKLLLKLLILCMLFILPIVSILSLIPRFSHSLLNALGKMILVFFVGIFLTVAIFLFFFLMTLIDSSVINLAGGSSIVSCLLAAVVKGLALFVILKGRNQIISFVTGGRVTNVNVPNVQIPPIINNGERQLAGETVGANNLAIDHADIEIEQAKIAANNLNDPNSKGTDFDSRDFAEIEVENAEIEVDDLDDLTETNENRDDSELNDLAEKTSEIGELDNPEVEALEIDELDNPEVEVLEIDELDDPEIGEPEIDELDTPEVEAPEIDELDTPEVEVPEIDELDSPEVEVPEIDELDSPEVEAPEIDELEVSEMEAPEIDGLSDSSIEVELSENHLRENEELSVHMSSIEAFDTNTQDVVVNVDEFINELNNLRNE